MSGLFVRIMMNCRWGTLSDRTAGTNVCVCARADVREGADGDRRRSDEDISRRI